MQKSKKATIAIIMFILLYGIFATFQLVSKVNELYLYIINPLVWISISVFLHFALGHSIRTNKKLRKPIIEYTVIASLIYIIVYMISGLVVTFGKNPYNTTLLGFIQNLWMTGIVIFSKEYIRFKLIDNVYEKEKIKIATLISIVYIFIDLEFNRIICTENTLLFITKYFLERGIPIIAKNIVFSYTAMFAGSSPAIIYQIFIKLYFWISPILPNSPWVMSTILETAIPIVLYLYIRYMKNKFSIFRNREEIAESNPKNIIPLIVVIIFAIWFAIGIFPIKPVAIASGSMEGELNVGDVAIIKKCNANDIEVGDIIEYQMEGYTVIHRVIEKNQKDGEFYFTTKGDKNNAPDKNKVTEEQLIGEVKFKIKYLGYPAIWIHKLQENEQRVEVETGK